LNIFIGRNLFYQKMIKLLHQQKSSVAKQIYRTFQASYAVEADLLGSDDFPPLKRTVKDIVESNTSFYGYLKKDVLMAVMEIQTNKTHIHIQSLTVDPQYFRQGIGNSLLNFAIDSFPSEAFTVETGLGNIPAIRLYENFGFIRQKIWMTEVGIEKIAFLLPVTN
jgi:ribosomal protein S18 acetylase RimI-like enzyme